MRLDADREKDRVFDGSLVSEPPLESPPHFFVLLDGAPSVEITPGQIVVPAWTYFRFVCSSRTPGSQVSAIFTRDGSSVDSDRRFQVMRFNESALEVIAPEGLRDVDDTEIA